MSIRVFVIKTIFVLSAILVTICPAVTFAETTDTVTSMVFVPVKCGCFEMGDTVGDGDPNERPAREVCVNDFSMGKYEVTNEQFRKFRPDHDSGKFEGLTLNEDKQPVVNVSWEDATEFAKWLSKKSGHTYRLPSEAEWEYAARSGTKTSHYWGNDTAEACTYANVSDVTAQKRFSKWRSFNCDDGFLVAAPVGSFKPNAYGLYDMLGNAWEWVQDIYNAEAYSKLPKNNPVYEGSGEYRVERGGGWSNGPMGVRSSHRIGLTPTFGHRSLGFRLVMEK
ncbi:formylglycine-generating enzyme family protein [Candidatus Magnetomonas plexicatena]|uniref:formylglycine-generating enzyme family protein n=1 Tax=Candidatus Magnetomonas plexicatena TaxID=2552947 RepID=UPI001C7445E0|nr:formylglycine-generating enzyme family protein [Nitrospirales bacterium LBB_01]